MTQREVVCPKCGSPVPFTGAYAFVICRQCRATVYVDHARRVEGPPSSGIELPTNLPRPDALSLYAAEEPPPHLVRMVARAAGTSGTGIILFLLVFEVAVLIGGIPAALSYAATGPGDLVPLFLAFPVPISFATLGGVAAQGWHLVLVLIIAASAAAMVIEHLPGAGALFMRVFEGRGTPALHEPNGLFTFTRFFTATIVVSVLVSMIASAVGQAPTVPRQILEEPIGGALILLAHASVWEELITRVLLLGLPLLFIHAYGRGKLEAPWWRYLVGGKMAMDPPAFVFVVFQAAIFGAAHIPGWDLWKFPGAFVTGLALGYLFLRLGLQACILLHFMTDYLPVTITFMEATSVPVLLTVAFLAIIAVGVVNLVRFVFLFYDWVRYRDVPPDVFAPRPPPPATPSPQAPAPDAPASPRAPPDPPG